MQFGRARIYIDPVEVTSANVVKLVNETLSYHTANARDIRYLREYEKGNQPILNRIKKIRPEINKLNVENHATEIKTFKLGYVFGLPVQYVQRKDSADKGEAIRLLNDMLIEEQKYSKDTQLATDFIITGVGYRLVYPKRENEVTGKSVFDVITLDPETTYICYSNDMYKKPVMAVTFAVSSDGSTDYMVYTNDRYFCFRTDAFGPTTGAALVEEYENRIGLIPIIEYNNDYERMGSFERVITLIDALNVASSDRSNAISQHVEAFLWADNVQLGKEGFDALREMGLVETQSDEYTKAMLQYVTAELNQVGVQSFVDDLIDKIERIAAMPGRELGSGGNTGEAMAMGNGWQLAETAARMSENVFRMSEVKALELMLRIAKISLHTGGGLDDLTVSDLNIKLPRNKTNNMLVKTQAGMNLQSLGVGGADCLAAMDLFDDPEEIYTRNKETMDAAIKKASGLIDNTQNVQNNTASGGNKGGEGSSND